MALSLQPRTDGFRLDPPPYFPPTFPAQTPPSQSPNENSPKYPFYRPPPLVRPVYPRLSSQATATVEEVEPDVEPEVVQELPTVKLSKKIHVLGFDPNAKFVVHALAAVPGLPPVQLLTHRTQTMTCWGQEGRAITVYNSGKMGKGNITSREIPCPEHIGLGHSIAQLERGGFFLHNIVVSTINTAICNSLFALRHRIDRRTTICLLNTGLGMMEQLNERVFDDPGTRPNYVLGHSRHILRRHSHHNKYSLDHKSGNLLLYAVPRDYEDPDLDLETAQHLSKQHVHNLIALLSSAEDLKATEVSWEAFLHAKLPGMIFQSLANTISVIMGCSFDQLRKNKHAMDFWERLSRETLHIVTSLPEFQNNADQTMLKAFTKESFAKRLKQSLRQCDKYSTWISMIRRGWLPPVDLINGYFVKRAKELELSYSMNSLAIYIVKARYASRRNELEADIPLSLMAKMDDQDKISSSQDGYDPNVDIELD
ncbi:uncharacterized protein F4822DRAFT_132628 [Hypoxylon trugodes]|uniref:uncharacterized protein n=1 Tax=Hypoxylon trugodes TaxID=326681 RepID=UPI0021A19ABE|nr:uncharacterized protein F4822DRAFT_132628 [Hypoxylon trugodes]KAI1392562.1 hypothetical protein F4822DRAFT_132628 [Hypoxylon trugodes]